MTDWQPFREPLRVTLTRTASLAVIAGGLVALWAGGLRRWPMFSASMLWSAVRGLHARGRPSFDNGLG